MSHFGTILFCPMWPQRWRAAALPQCHVLRAEFNSGQNPFTASSFHPELRKSLCCFHQTKRFNKCSSSEGEFKQLNSLLSIAIMTDLMVLRVWNTMNWANSVLKEKNVKIHRNFRLDFGWPSLDNHVLCGHILKSHRRALKLIWINSFCDVHKLNILIE